jgi:5-formyltetrahydrofolate cyclo-ligase
MQEEKRALRARLRAQREALDPGFRAQASARIAQHLVALIHSRKIRSVGAFWPLGAEVDLRPLFGALPDRVFLFPRVASTSPPRLIWGPEPLEPGPWGLMEPAFAQHLTPPVQLLLVPGLAFDPQGHRLGYGRGFYDALLGHLSPEIPTIGVGFGCQAVHHLPIEPHDLPVQGLVNEGGIRWFRAQEEGD